MKGFFSGVPFAIIHVSSPDYRIFEKDELAGNGIFANYVKQKPGSAFFLIFRQVASVGYAHRWERWEERISR